MGQATNDNMELNMDTELDKKMDLNERLVQSLLSVAFFAPVNGSCFNVVYGEIMVGETPTGMMNRKVNGSYFPREVNGWSKIVALPKRKTGWSKIVALPKRNTDCSKIVALPKRNTGWSKIVALPDLEMLEDQPSPSVEPHGVMVGEPDLDMSENEDNEKNEGHDNSTTMMTKIRRPLHDDKDVKVSAMMGAPMLSELEKWRMDEVEDNGPPLHDDKDKKMMILMPTDVYIEWNQNHQDMIYSQNVNVNLMLKDVYRESSCDDPNMMLPCEKLDALCQKDDEPDLNMNKPNDEENGFGHDVEDNEVEIDIDVDYEVGFAEMKEDVAPPGHLVTLQAREDGSVECGIVAQELNMMNKGAQDDDLWTMMIIYGQPYF